MRAFISVSDKTGVVEFAKELCALGYEVLSTGGTAKALREAGVAVTGVSEVTGFPECLDGRVKTLHPKIHAGILAIRDNPEHMRQIEELGVTPIDVVAVNLYPFKQTIAKPGVELAEAIENIDIGGPSMLRAAAKNYRGVYVVVDSADYAGVINEIKNGSKCEQTRFYLAAKVFNHTAAYDALIASYLEPRAGMPEFGDKKTFTYEKVQDMRYGENPHQKAAFYREVGARPGCLTDAAQLNGKELSYNNINDTNGALDLLREFNTPCCIGVKHANPCGVGCAETALECYNKAYEADPVSIFGGIVVINLEVDKATAEEMVKTFLEIVVAPSYTADALEVLKTKPNLRVMELPTINAKLENAYDMKKVAGGLLIQDMDSLLTNPMIEVVTERQPTEKEMDDAMLAWKIVKHTKSNAIAIAKDGQSLGIGPGQVNRIWATNSAIERSAERVKGAAMGSDAFFPFDDCVKAAAEAGITCIIQPGGAGRDQDSIDACNKAGISMIFTGMRHFKH